MDPVPDRVGGAVDPPDDQVLEDVDDGRERRGERSTDGDSDADTSAASRASQAQP